MATTPTNLPVPSESPRDLKFNAGKIDEFVTSLALKYVDRFGGEHYTIEGLRQLAQQAIAAYGWVPMDSFQAGATLTLPNQVLRWKLPDGDGDYYRWSGTLPKSVPENSTPESTGGIGAGAWLSVGDSVLRSQLASSSEGSGASMVMTSSGITVQQALEAAATTESIRENIVYATADYGIPNDGSDVSNQVSTFINANKGKFIVFDSGTYMFAGVELTGSGWEGTVIYFKGKHLLSPNTANTNNKWGSFNGIIVNSTVNDLTLYYRGDGNRANQPDKEHTFNVIIAGSTNINIPEFYVKEIRGDGIYISKADPLNSSSTDPVNITMGNVVGSNSAIDGRNLVSLISCLGGSISYLKSVKIGGTVAGVVQPGGFDAEPNGPTFFVRDFTITHAYIEDAGTGGVGFFGGSNYSNIRNCSVLHASLLGNAKLLLRGVTDSSFNVEALNCTTFAAMTAENSQKISVNMKVNGSSIGAIIGSNSAVSDSTLNFLCDNIDSDGVRVVSASNCDFNVKIRGFRAATGNLIGVWFRNSGTFTTPEVRDCRFNIQCRKGVGANKAVDYYTASTFPITFTGSNILLDSCNFSGYADFFSVLGNAGSYLIKSPKIPGLTYSNTGQPSDGAWVSGDIMSRVVPSGLIYGYIRLTTGTGNIAGTDWATLRYVNS
ncbi:tail fiber/spike domain-containing protein [Hafnia alvei]|uniref:tail fiber/spike domain-containing protein n=1 Tax=Hafnia alvei TaxID=569 RepID=UPI00187D5EA7|nr:hypothetical protein [Hafnia alvei]